MKIYIKLIIFLSHLIPISRIRIALLRLTGVKIGKNCKIFKASWGSEPYLIELGDHVVISNGTRFITHDGGVWVFREKYPRIDLFGKIMIGNNVCIGLNVIILPNTQIGDNCIVAAGSVVKGKIPENSIVYGNPAKVIMPLYIQERLILMSKFKFETKGMSYRSKKKILKSFFDKAKTKVILAGLLISGLFSSNQGFSQNIFPGSQGMGTASRGAYAGDSLPKIVVVDNLDDYGPGSFRYAVTRPYPRIVVFEVAGDIHLKRPLIVTPPYLYVAGQTSPGKGVALWGQPFVVSSHDVLIQNMRFRLGSKHEDQSDCVTVRGTNRRVYNVVFDRCSFAFGLDETLTVINAGPGITISNSIIGYSLNKLNHSCGLLVLNSSGVSLIRNVIAFNADRNPSVRGNVQTIEILNNLIYNSSNHAVYLGSRGIQNLPLSVLIEGNLYITGVNNVNRFLLSVHKSVPDSLLVYWSDNMTIDGDQTYVDYELQLYDKSERFYPLPDRPFPISAEGLWKAGELPERLLNEAGAFAFNRDAIDSLIIENIRTGKGNIIAEEDELKVTLTLPVEERKFIIPDNPHELKSNGFTRLELFLNNLLLK